MLYLKSCPRCKGDIIANRDMYGEYRECLQCGYMVDIDKPKGILSIPLALKKKVASLISAQPTDFLHSR